MTLLDPGPCQIWPPIWDCVTLSPAGIAVTGTALQAATEILWNRTHRRFGVCAYALRPCRKTCWPDGWRWAGSWTDVSGWGWPFPALIGGAWFNLGCSACGDSCSCSTLQEAVLPYPVAAVTEVKVDGVALAPSAYRVDGWRVLVRTDDGSWPLCNDLSKADTEAGTWSVTAQYGEQVPSLGSLAVGELGLEIVKRLCGSGDCKLPAGTVREVTRQGVRKVFVDNQSLGFHTGLYWPDLFLDTYNPGRNQVASILNIDGPRSRRVGT